MSATENLNHYFQMENATSVLEDVISQMENAPEEITRVDEDEVQNIVGLVNQNIVEGEFEETAALGDGLLGADQSLEVMKDSLIEKHEEMQTEASNFFTRLFDNLADQFKDIWGQNEQRLKRLKEAREHIEKFEGDTLTFKSKDVEAFKLGYKVDFAKVIDNIGQMVNMVKKDELTKMYLEGIHLMGKRAAMGESKDANKFVESMRRNSVYKVPSIFGQRTVEPGLNMEFYTFNISNALRFNVSLPLPFSSRMPEFTFDTHYAPHGLKGEVKLSKKEVVGALDKLIKIASDVPTKKDFEQTRRLIITELEKMANEKVDLKTLDDTSRTVSENYTKALLITGVLSVSIMVLTYFQMKPPRSFKPLAVSYGAAFGAQLLSTLTKLGKSNDYERDLIINGDLDMFSSQDPIIRMFLTRVMNSLSSRTTALVIRHHIAVQHVLNVLTKQLPIAVYRAK